MRTILSCLYLFSNSLVRWSTSGPVSLYSVFYSLGSSVTSSVTSVFVIYQSSRSFFSEVIDSNPGPTYFLASPTNRTRPSWLLPSMGRLSVLITEVLRRHKPNLTSLRAYNVTKDELDSDGIHLTALAGRDYVTYLLDQAQ